MRIANESSNQERKRRWSTVIPQQVTDEEISQGNENQKSNKPKGYENVNSVMRVSPMECGSWSPQRRAGMIFTLNLELQSRFSDPA
jgi:hypothetical protein